MQTQTVEFTELFGLNLMCAYDMNIIEIHRYLLLIINYPYRLGVH